MLLCGPPCGLFVFLSSSYHRRSSLFPYGDQSNKKIRAANQLVINFLIILSVADVAAETSTDVDRIAARVTSLSQLLG
ncbi:unnamed protein product [Effrenium voratum]|nr:unnamed protein product [Effrenium voratum]